VDFDITAFMGFSLDNGKMRLLLDEIQILKCCSELGGTGIILIVNCSTTC